MSPKQVYIIGGSNGAGKTTFALEFLPYYVDCPRFINPDLIAAGLSPFDPPAAATMAGRLVLGQIERAMRQGDSFAIESTLSGKTYLRFIHTAKRNGYDVHLFYLWIPDPELALARIRDRVETGGHDVPERDVRRRYPRTLRNLFRIYRPVVDTLHCFDNSSDTPRLIFKDEEGETTVLNETLYQSIQPR